MAHIRYKNYSSTSGNRDFLIIKETTHMETPPLSTIENEEASQAIGRILLGANGSYELSEDGQPPHWDPETVYSQSHFGNDINQVQ
jgi:hypothetical protein